MELLGRTALGKIDRRSEKLTEQCVVKQLKLENDIVLLEKMIAAQNSAPSAYQPGPYWVKKTERSKRELISHGLQNFRSSQNNSTRSYGDALLSDITKDYDGLKYYIGLLANKVPPFNAFLRSQRNLSAPYIKKIVDLEGYILNYSDRVRFLLEKYKIGKGQLLGEVDRASSVLGEVRSHHFVHLLDLMDHMIDAVVFEENSTYMEIGGGFGANTCLVLENFPQITKYIYIDIAPNLYVGTQFLKANYGNAVSDFAQFDGVDSIRFADNLETEIFCLLPHQIEKIEGKVQYFHNANSFVEMPIDVVENYAKNITNIMTDTGKILLATYGHYDPNSTLDPDLIRDIFGVPMAKFEHNLILGDRKPQIFYAS